ncbi:hypothetical protein GF338_02415, partial [candidate division WOR-3 bacterium]|nr:hypothetical protein [candidate division WOR-3 bacterium]
MPRKTKVLVLVVVLAFSLNLSAQIWGPVEKLSNAGYPCQCDMGHSHTNTVVSDGDNVYVVWRDCRQNGGMVEEIYFNKSNDGGMNWIGDMPVSNLAAGGYSSAPAVAVSGPNVHVVWSELLGSTISTMEIFYRHSADGGANWDPLIQLTNNQVFTDSASIAVSGDTVHIAFPDKRTGDLELYYKVSYDNGANWEPDLQISNVAPDEAKFPSIAVGNGEVHIAYEISGIGGVSAYDTYFEATDPTQRTDKLLSSTGVLPCVASDGDNFHCVWVEKRSYPNDDEIYHMMFDGSNWGSKQLVTADQSLLYTSVSASGADVFAVFEDISALNTSDIKYIRSMDFGSTWGAESNLSNHPEESERPSIFFSGLDLHVVWCDNRNSGNFEIFYTGGVVRSWPMFHRDFRNTGRSPLVGVITSSSLTGSDLATNAPVNSSPALVDVD